MSRKQLLIISERESGMCHASCQKCSQIRDEREREYFFDSDPWARAQPLVRRKCSLGKPAQHLTILLETTTVPGQP